MNSSPTPSGAENASPPEGWYPDPVSTGRLRLWDGSSWTDRVRSAEVPQTAEPGPISFVGPDSPAWGAPAAQQAPAPEAYRSPYGTPLDFRGTSLARPAADVTANPRGPAGGLTSDGVPLAGWGQRAVATVIDWVVNLVMVGLVLTVGVKDFWARYSAESTAWADRVMAGQGALLEMSPELLHLGVLMTGVAGVVSVLYGITLLGLTGATLGQRLLGLRVVPFGRGRERLGWVQAVVRTLVWTVLAQGGSFIMLVQLVSVLLPLWHPHKQTIPDLIARTQVVKSPPAAADTSTTQQPGA